MAGDDPVAFAAFVALCSIHRRSKNHGAHQSLIEAQKERFSHHPLFPHLELLLYVDNNFVYEKKDDILQTAKKNAGQFSDHAGILHAFSDLVATAFEHAEMIDAQPPEEHWIKEGVQAVEQALALQRYAKFYCTKARLLALQGEFGQAQKLIRTAIDLENSGEADYVLRIHQYLAHLQRIQTKKVYLDLQQQAQEVQDKLDHSMSRNLEFIGLFAGIVSFTIGSISLAGSLANVSLAGAAGLIVVLMGALLCVFAGFSNLLHRHQTSHQSVKIFLVGLVLLAIGLALCFLL